MIGKNVEYFDKAFTVFPIGKRKIKEREYLIRGELPIVDQGKKLVSGYTDQVSLAISGEPFIAFGDHTRAIKFIDFPFVAGADGLRLFNAKAGYLPKFLYYFLQAQQLPIDSYGRHSKYLYELQVPKLTETKQVKLVKHVDNALAEVETARAAVTAQLRDVQALTDAIYKNLLSTMDVPIEPLKKVLNGIQAGKSFLTAEYLAGEHELGVLKVSAVSWQRFKPEEAKALLDKYEPKEMHRIRQGDLLISRANTKELIGAVVLCDKDYPNRLLSDKTLRLLVDEGQASKDFILIALRLPLARKHIEHFATGTSDSMRNISHPIISAIPIPLPPLREQVKIAERVNSQLAELELLRSAIKHRADEILMLPQRILASAFEM